MSTQNERSAKAQVIWNSTNSNSVTPTMVGSLLYDINAEKLERDNSNAVYQTYDASYTKVAAINPITKKISLIDFPSVDLSNYYTKTELDTALATKQDRLQDVIGNIGVGKSDTIATEKLDVNGYVKATGFKKEGGTSTQFLMADGSVKNTITYINSIGGNRVLSDWYITSPLEGGMFSFIGDDYPALSWGPATAYMSDEYQFCIDNAAINQSSNLINYFTGAISAKGGLVVSNAFRFLGSNLKTSADTIGKLSSKDVSNGFELVFNRTAAGIGSYYGIQSVEQGIGYRDIVLQKDGGNVGIGIAPSEKLDVNGNIKSLQVKDQYGTLKSQRSIPITGDITLSEIHNGAVLNVTNTCNITIPTGLDANFQCVIFAKGSVIVTFVNGGVTVYAPSGLLLKTDKMASLICTATNNFNLTGELATS